MTDCLHNWRKQDAVRRHYCEDDFLNDIISTFHQFNSSLMSLYTCTLKQECEPQTYYSRPKQVMSGSNRSLRGVISQLCTCPLQVRNTQPNQASDHQGFYSPPGDDHRLTICSPKKQKVFSQSLLFFSTKLWQLRLPDSSDWRPRK